MKGFWGTLWFFIEPIFALLIWIMVAAAIAVPLGFVLHVIIDLFIQGWEAYP